MNDTEKPKPQTGVVGVFPVAAELARRGFIVSPTSRNAFGADLLVTDQRCNRAWPVVGGLLSSMNR